MYSVFVEGQNVYACGNKIVSSIGSTAMIWKNNQSTQLSQSFSVAYTVFATSTNTYVAGIETSTACLWKDGIIQKLSTKPSEAKSIFVTEK